MSQTGATGAKVHFRALRDVVLFPRFARPRASNSDEIARVAFALVGHDWLAMTGRDWLAMTGWP